MLAPKGTRRDVLMRIHAAVKEALNDPEVRKRLVDGDFGIIGSSPDEFGPFLVKEFDAYGRIIKATGVSLGDTPK